MKLLAQLRIIFAEVLHVFGQSFIGFLKLHAILKTIILITPGY